MNRRIAFVLCISFAVATLFAQDPRERQYMYEILDPRHEAKPLVEGFATERVTERLNRGLYAVPSQDGKGVYLSWRLLNTDAPATAFHVYREANGKTRRLTNKPILHTCDFVDNAPVKGIASYWVVPVLKGQKPAASEKLEVEAGKSKNYTSIRLKDNAKAGKIALADLNGDGSIDDFDKGAIGKPNLPTTTLGWSFGGYWKGFSFNVLFQGSFDYSFAINGTGIESFKSQFQPIHTGRWTLDRYKNGEEITFPRLTTNPSTINSASTYMSDFWLINAWYIRLKTIDLGYQLPKKVLPKYVDNIRFYVNAYNLLTFTGYDKYQQDPEIKTNTAGDAYMNQRVLNLGVQLTF